MFTVGEGGRVMWYDGELWTQMAQETNATLMGVHGISRADFMLTGANGTAIRFTGELPVP